MTISLIKSLPTGGPTWIVKSGAAFLGEITHVDTLDWSATAMDGTHFHAHSKPKAIQRLRIHAAAERNAAVAQPLRDIINAATPGGAEMRKRKPGVDPLCHDLAEHFLRDVEGATAMDSQELAEAIQRICEDVCRDLEGEE